MRRVLLIGLPLIVGGVIVVALPDSGPRLFSLSRRHGPSFVDASGIALLLAGVARNRRCSRAEMGSTRPAGRHPGSSRRVSWLRPLVSLLSPGAWPGTRAPGWRSESPWPSYRRSQRLLGFARAHLSPVGRSERLPAWAQAAEAHSRGRAYCSIPRSPGRRTARHRRPKRHGPAE